MCATNYNCGSLEDIVWNENLTSLGNSAFNECKSLQHIALPASLTYKGKDILKGCDHLIEVTVPFMGSTIEKGDKFSYTISAGSSSTNYTGSGGFDFPKTLKKFTVLAGDITDYAFAAQIPIGSAANYQFDLIFGDGVTRFGKGVFEYNDSYVNGYIKSVALGKNVKYFADYAFYGISAIKEFNFDNVEYIGQYAFSKTGLEKVVIPANLQIFGNYAFANNKYLKSVTLPVTSLLHTIPVGAFMGCPSIERVDLPVSVTRIGEKAFQNCTALTEVRIPTGMTNVGNYAFDGCPNLNNVYTYTVEPQDIQQDTFSSYQTATLYCPKVSYYNYYYATPWNRFLKLAEFDEPYEYVYIEKDFSILRDVVSGEPEFIVGNKGALIMESIVKQLAKIFHINMDAVTGVASSIISNGMIDALELEVSIDVKKDFWHFFCFPFDVDLTKVKKDGSWIFRQFDGHLRAENGAGNSWQDIEGTTLKAGKGYIFRTNTAGPLTLTIDNPKFDHESAKAVLEECTKTSGETENADKNWNFIGNLFTSYYDMNDLDYSSPIVVWDGTKYVAYRPGDDDDLVLTPFQAFFVQKPDGVANVGFDKDGRTTYLQSQENVEARSAARRKAAARLDSNRQLVNLTVSDGESVDKARVVFNEKQTMDYELGCDASKFISTENVPLIYSLDARGTRYAINERPMADGRVNLGFIAREDGTYTIAATRMDVPMVLIDNVTGTTHDLNDGEYTFTADKGTYDKRFVLAVAEDYLAEGINAVNADEQGAAAKIYDLQGKRVERQQGVTIQNGKKVVSAM